MLTTVLHRLLRSFYLHNSFLYVTDTVRLMQLLWAGQSSMQRL